MSNGGVGATGDVPVLGPAAVAPRYEIVAREDFSDLAFALEIRHPRLAQAAQPGQFVIVMGRDSGERIPLTLADFDAARGTITLVVQASGKTTRELQQDARPGTGLFSVAGPMGVPSHFANMKKVICVGGGLGVAPVYPQARALQQAGAQVFGVLGFRSKSLVFWEDRFRACCQELVLCTDDGSTGLKGLVTEGIRKVVAAHPDIDHVIAVGPPIMMRACAEATRALKIPTVVSLNPVMIDGTGMCGGCRVKVDNRIRFACIDGPDFDAHKVDFDDLMNRLRRFKAQEQQALQRWSESCRMGARG